MKAELDPRNLIPNTVAVKLAKEYLGINLTQLKSTGKLANHRIYVGPKGTRQRVYVPHLLAYYFDQPVPENGWLEHSDVPTVTGFNTQEDSNETV